MKFQSTILSALILSTALLVSTAQADVTGTWQGYGDWSYDGSSVPCLMTIRYQENEKQIHRVRGELNCDILVMHSDPYTWQKDGNILKVDGKMAGSWDDFGFQTIEMGTDKVEVVTDFNTTTGKYKEFWRNTEDGTVIYLIEAKLQRK